jgi:hypothetical protein
MFLNLYAHRAKNNFRTVFLYSVSSTASAWHDFLLTYLLVAKPCAHVTCKTCTDTLVRPAKQCIECSTQLKEKDILELKREG